MMYNKSTENSSLFSLIKIIGV